MNSIRSRGRLLRLAGVVLLTVAIAIIPAGAAFAADPAQSGSQSAWWAPTPPEDLSAAWYDDGDSLRGEVQLSWEDPADNLNPVCYWFMFLCYAGMFSLSHPAYADAPTEYIVERRSFRRVQRAGYAITYTGRWSQKATVAAGGETGEWQDGNMLGMPPRTFHYRVKACNAQGCSGWSNVSSVYVTYTWCEGRAPGTLRAFCEV